MQHKLRMVKIRVETGRAEPEKEENIEKAQLRMEREARMAQNAAQGPVTNQRHDNLKELLPSLKGGDDADAFLRTFEKVAKLHGWGKELWGGRLAPLLTGKAREAYPRLSDNDCGNYDAIKRAILLKYDLTPVAYKQKFCRMIKCSDESYVEYGARMRDAFDRWVEGKGAKGDAVKLEDT